MAQLLGEHPAVTSCHHQAADRLAEPLRPVQWAEDGVTEAVVHQELPVLGSSGTRSGRAMPCAGRTPRTPGRSSAIL